MAALPYMQLYVADYLADTAHLSTVEHGAYLLLIFNYWQRGGSFRAKDERSLNARLASVARMSNEEWLEVRESLEEFFSVSETEWSHDRIDRDLEAVNSKSEKAKAAGKASAASRAVNRDAGSERTFNGRSTDAEQTLNHTDTDTDTDTEKEKKKQGAKAAARFRPPTVEEVRTYCEERGNTVDPETFVDFYAANGWVQGKGKPIKDWRAAVRTWEKGERNGSAKPDAPLEIPEGNDMPARSALWKLCQECDITADEVRDQTPDYIRDLIRARHPRAVQRPKLRAIDGGRAA